MRVARVTFCWLSAEERRVTDQASVTLGRPVTLILTLSISLSTRPTPYPLILDLSICHHATSVSGLHNGEYQKCAGKALTPLGLEYCSTTHTSLS